VAAGLRRSELAAWVGAEPGESGASSSVTRRWYDTFDWRLWQRGLVLEVDEVAPGRREAVLRDRDDHHMLWSQTVAVVPPTASELPAGPWRRSLGPLLGPRALIPVATAALERDTIRVADANGKTVAQASWEAVRPGADGDAPARWVRVVPVRGYARDAGRLAERLAAHPNLTAVGAHPLETAIADGRAPGQSGVVLDIRLEPETPAEEAALAMLRHLYGSMRTVEPWLSEPPDTEFLHDYRVALRRSRSVLKLSRGVLARPVLDEWRRELRDLQQRSGELRDLDVFVLEFPSYREALPPEFARELGPLLDLLEMKRRRARTKLDRYLRSAGHARLKNRYADLLVGGTGPALAGQEPDARRPIVEVAVDRIRRSHRRLVRRGRRVEPGSPPRMLHEVRIAAKELRYAIELNASLLPESDRRRMVKRIKRFQDLLGQFQDAEVHAIAMETFADELAASTRAPARSIMAIGLLAQDFNESKEELRDQFAERFVEFDTRSTKELLTRMLDRAVTRS
jgi:CHAD domain-containing protein